MTVAALSRIRPPRWSHPDSVGPTLHRVAKRSFAPKRSAVAEPQSRRTRLTVALLVSLLAHTTLMFRLGEPLPLPVSKPEIPPRIVLNLSEAPLPPVIAPAPLSPVIAPEAAPPAPVIESAPPPLVAKAPPAKPKPRPVKPRPRSESQRPDPKPLSSMASASPPAASVNTPPASPQPRLLQPSAKPVTEPPPLLLNPRYRRPPAPPVYPPSAIRLDQQGTVLVQARISTAGDVIEMSVHQSSGHPLLDTAALAAVHRWAFVPAARNNQPVEAWVRVPVHFVLNAR